MREGPSIQIVALQGKNSRPYFIEVHLLCHYVTVPARYNIVDA